MQKIIIKGELTTLNEYINAERSSRHMAAKIKKDNTYLCQWQMKGIKPITGRVTVCFDWYCKNKKVDPDNIAATGHKFIFDAMVQEGILQNDGWNQVAGLADKFYIDVNNPRVEIYIEEVRS